MPDFTVVYGAPAGVEPSADFRLRINGQEAFVHHCRDSAYAICSVAAPVQVEVETAFDFREVKVRPLSRGVRPHADGRRLRFALDGPVRLSIEFDGDIRRPLFLFAAPPEADPPSPGDPGVRYFEAGKVHEAGVIELSDGETVYIEGGAVVRGTITAQNADNIAVRGRGILDGSRIDRQTRRRPRMMDFVNCRNLTVEGITVADSPSWTVVPTGCAGLTVRGVNIMTWDTTGDGVDLVGSRDAVVEDCFLRCADDCVAVKATSYRHECGNSDVENIRVRRCVCWNAHPGNALEIGYETRCDSMSDIAFENCDIIRCEHEGHQSGGTFTIHNGDRATVSNVRYENIRVEDSREKLIDLKILYARYSRDEQRGHIRGVRFKDISVVDGPFPVSIIQGYDGEHMIEDVTIENLVVHDRKIANANEARMVVELAPGVRFI